jgi:hypothetical protein
MTRETAPKGGSPILPARTTCDEDTSGAVDEIASQLGATVDRLGRYGDLDQARAVLDGPPGVLEALWAKVDELARHRKIQPELRRDLLRVAERVDPELAERLEDELDEAVPAAVLEAHWRELVPDRAALGAFPRRDCTEAPTALEWLLEDPLRLRNVTLEIARFTKDDRLVAESVLGLAEQLGIDPELAVDVVTHGLIDARHPVAVAR